MLRVKSLLNTCPARIGLCLLYTSMCIRDSTELESDDVDTIAGYYLTGVGAIPTQEVKEHYEVINKDKHLEFINDKVKDGRVTKLKVIITSAPEEAGE